MEDYKFGGSRTKAFLGSFLNVIAQLVKWIALSSITRLNKLSRWLNGTSAHLLQESRYNVITDVKKNLLNRHICQYRFKNNGAKRTTYEEGDFKEVYKLYQKEDLEITETDYYYLRYNQSWRKD
ncbi:MAG: hypothetical protein Unbinned4388contig1000_47 [Prokaryotic dsDNA virus sp.]|nr:MAG: hypothetical protein Unbinned4388contig1000_47 [Prokaryotic dsDNA virus sp.]|tara:strand:- start:62550 stop:62921 length:372 start_codon:yes stop_codon:yes gene_type:complete